jgi:hypothetical protein
LYSRSSSGLDEKRIERKEGFKIAIELFGVSMKRGLKVYSKNTEMSLFISVSMKRGLKG